MKDQIDSTGTNTKSQYITFLSPGVALSRSCLCPIFERFSWQVLSGVCPMPGFCPGFFQQRLSGVYLFGWATHNKNVPGFFSHCTLNSDLSRTEDHIFRKTDTMKENFKNKNIFGLACYPFVQMKRNSLVCIYLSIFDRASIFS